MTNQTFEQLKKTYESGRTRPLAWRRAQLNALRRLVTENRDAFVSSAMADLGKPAAETVLMELNLVAGEAQFVRNRLSLWTARHPKAMHWMLQPAAGWTIAEPKGVVLIISPWNYPVLLALEPMADALAAGNAVCLKPSELSPNTSKLLAELVPQYLDSEAVRVVEGGPKETGELLKCPFNHIFYTGGGHVGKIVMRAAAEHLTPVTLELGGKSPCFVDRTADINVAARRIAWGKFTNAGQTCVAPDYVLATPDVAEALAERIAVAITEFYGEDPKASPDFGRIINDRHFERLCKLLPVGTVPPEEPSSPLVQVASAVGAAMDMVGRRFNAVTTGRGGAGEMAGSANNAAKPTAGSNMAAADDGATASAAVEPSEIHKVPGVFDLAGRIVCGGKVDRAARYIAPAVLYGTSPDAPVMKEPVCQPRFSVRADSADSGGRGCRVRNPIHQQAVPAVGCICVLARSRGSADFRTSDQLRSLGIFAAVGPSAVQPVAVRWRGRVRHRHLPRQSRLPHLQPRQNRGYQAAVPRHSAPRVPALQ